MQKGIGWKVSAMIVAALLATAVHARKDLDADPSAQDTATSPAPKGGASACPSGRFSDAKCQCGARQTKKYMGNNQYECMRAFNPQLATACPSGRFNADQHPDCACAGVATKTYMGNNQYLCSETAGKPCPVEGVFTVSGNQGCKCPADMRFVPQPGNQTADCECTAADKKKWNDPKTGIYCRTRVECRVDRPFERSTDWGRFCDCPTGYVRVKAQGRHDRCQQSLGPVACPVGQWFLADGPLVECVCPANTTRLTKPGDRMCQAPSLGPVPCPVDQGVSKYDALRDCQCPAGYNKTVSKSGLNWCRKP